MLRYALILMALCVGCASGNSGAVPIGPDLYMITNTAVGDVWSDGSGVLVDLYRDANEHCAKQGLVALGVSEETQDGRVYVRNASATLRFRCIAVED